MEVALALFPELALALALGMGMEVALALFPELALALALGMEVALALVVVLELDMVLALVVVLASVFHHQIHHLVYDYMLHLGSCIDPFVRL